MARPCRLQGENCFYHITSRGDNRKKIFISNYDFKQFLEYLLIAKAKYRFNLYAYCLMPNHYHLLIETLQPNLSKIMQYINTSYTVYYNTKRNKVGHLFQGRFKSIMIDEDEYFLELTRYIHLNPVKAKMVETPENYKWSSYGGYLKPKHNKYIDYPELNHYLGMKPSAYKEFVLSSMNKRDILFNNVYAGSFLGGRDFVKNKIAKFKPEIESGDFAHKRKLKPEIGLEDIINRISKIFNEDISKIVAKKNSRSDTRKIAIYAARRITGLTNKEIGSYFNVSDSAVGKAEKKILCLLKQDKILKKRVDSVFSVFRV
jgi:REP element-mobilizing transposase RayT